MSGDAVEHEIDSLFLFGFLIFYLILVYNSNSHSHGQTHVLIHIIINS